MSLVCDPTGANDYLICFACHDLERRLAAVTKERDDAIALNHMYYRARHEHRDFAKNAQDQRDDWMKEAQGFETRLAALQRENEGLREERERLPANWFEDASLETWFPITAEELTRLRADLATKDAQIAELQEHLAKAVDREAISIRIAEDNISLRAELSALSDGVAEKLSDQRRHLCGMHDETIAELDRVRKVAKEMIEAATARAEAAESLVETCRKAATDFRDCVLNQRNQLEAPCLDNDQTNAVLGLFDDHFADLPVAGSDGGEK